jgi:hypothetical protein
LNGKGLDLVARRACMGWFAGCELKPQTIN